MAATLFDAIVVTFFSVLASALTIFLTSNQKVIMVMPWIITIVTILYFAISESSSRQATFGKMIFGIRVTDLHGKRISIGRAIGRYLVKILFLPIFFVGSLMTLFTKNRQAPHDLIAQTLVLEYKEANPVMIVVIIVISVLFFIGQTTLLLRYLIVNQKVEFLKEFLTR